MCNSLLRYGFSVPYISPTNGKPIRPINGAIYGHVCDVHSYMSITILKPQVYRITSLENHIDSTFHYVKCSTAKTQIPQWTVRDAAWNKALTNLYKCLRVTFEVP